MAHLILAEITASISELKRNPIATVASGEGSVVAIHNRNELAFYCIPAKTYEALIERIEYLDLNKFADSRKGQPTIKVSINDL